MTDPICTIAKEEAKHLLKLYRDAQGTPVITFSVGEPSFAEKAWDNVREFQIELGQKYKFDWEKVKIDGKTGKVYSI